MNGEKLTPITNKPSLWALSPLLVFLCLYLVTSIIVNDFYKVPITIAFMVSSVYAVCITKGLSLNERMLQYSIGAANKNIMLMIWIFILAGAFAQSAKDIGAIDATVNLTLLLLPDNLLLAGIFLAACFISLSIGTSVGTIVALVPVAAGIAEKTDMNLAFMTGIVVGGAFFGDNLSFISDTTIAATRTQGCAMRDKFRVNFMIALPAALMVFGYYIFRGMDVMTTHDIQSVEWIKILPYLVVLGTAIAGMNVALVLILGIATTGVIGLFTLMAAEAVFGAVRNWRGMRRVLESTGVVVMAHGRVVDEHLRRSHVTYSDIMAALRARGVPNPDLVQCVILESTGGLSVFDSGEPVDPRILDGVVGAELVTAGAPTDAEVRAAGARSARASSPEGTGGRSPGVPESGDGAGQSAGEAHRPGHGPADGPRR